MSLIACRECKKEISNEALTCPHCGVSEPFKSLRDIVFCTHCGSSKTNKISFALIGSASFLTAGCLMWIPILGWIMAPICFLGAIVLWVLAAVSDGKELFHCKNCNRYFKITKKQTTSENS
jgi:RNA polymerase subunit RPABC4/transcription elongation factor Spt4